MNVAKIFLGTKGTNDFIKKRCLLKIGEGCFRDVFELKDYPKLVAKIEKVGSFGTFANATEWRNFINNQYWLDIKDWLAPCHGITQEGVILIQSKVAQKNFCQYPEKIPNLFTDTKYSNFGWIGKKFVCCDYSFFVQTSFRMKKVKWWGEKDININKK